MDENEFMKLLTSYSMRIRDTIVPTRSFVTLYGESEMQPIIQGTNEEIFYSYVKPMTISDEEYNQLIQTGKNDADIIFKLQSEYEDYLKVLRRKILQFQSMWSKNFANGRARIIMHTLEWYNIYHICDLVNSRLVPIELILKECFGIQSYYGQFRTKKAKNEIYVDPRLLNIPGWKKKIIA